VLVEAAGFPAAETSPITAPATDLLLRVAGEGRSILGRVVRAANEPAPGARVLLGDEAGGPVRETICSADGRFAFGGLGDGSYALRAIDHRQVSATVRGIAAGRDGTNLPAPLRLAPGETIGGCVVEDAGAALPGIEVRVEFPVPGRRTRKLGDNDYLRESEGAVYVNQVSFPTEVRERGPEGLRAALSKAAGKAFHDGGLLADWQRIPPA